MAKITCDGCGRKIPDTEESCPHCGQMIQKNGRQTDNLEETRKSRKNVIAICAVAVIILGVIAGFSIHSYNVRKAEEEYQEQLEQAEKEYQAYLNLAVEGMGEGAENAETSCGLIHDVWYNTIYEKSDRTTNRFTKKENGDFNSDFNVSLRNLFQDEDFSTLPGIIEEHQDAVGDVMKKLADPPDKFKSAYDAVWDLYGAYLELTNLAANPTGSLQSYTQSYNEADANFVKYYKAARIYTD